MDPNVRLGLFLIGAGVGDFLLALLLAWLPPVGKAALLGSSALSILGGASLSLGFFRILT